MNYTFLISTNIVIISKLLSLQVLLLYTYKTKSILTHL